MNPLLISAGTYALTRGLSYLSTRPVVSAPDSLFNRLRSQVAVVPEKMKKTLEDHRWSFFSNVIWDNLWISAYVISCLYPSFKPSLTLLETVGSIVILGTGVSTLGWMSRYFLAKVILPQDDDCLRPLIAPKQD